MIKNSDFFFFTSIFGWKYRFLAWKFIYFILFLMKYSKLFSNFSAKMSKINFVRIEFLDKNQTFRIVWVYWWWHYYDSRRRARNDLLEFFSFSQRWRWSCELLSEGDYYSTTKEMNVVSFFIKYLSCQWDDFSF